MRSVMRTASFGARLVVVAISAINVSIAAYLGLLTAVGAAPARRRHRRTPTTRFAIFVPAHDEEAVIGDTLVSFRHLDYDATMYEVHVVADNCSDRTADVVRAAGWSVHERVAPDDPGKGPALNWLFDRVDSSCDFDFDVVVVVDADTVVASGFLRAMDRAVGAGADVAQGFYSVREPESSPLASIRFAALACRHHLRALGRTRLGASCGLYGNGMAFRRDLLRVHRWSGHLVEDAEFQMELLLTDGIRVVYVPDALVEAEMPHTMAATTTQHERWEAGRADLARRYVPRLLGGLGRARGRRVAYLDAIADHAVPPFSSVVAMQLAGLVMSAASSTVRSGRPRAGRAGRLHVALVIVSIVHVMSGLRSVAAPSSVYAGLTRAPAMIVWKVRLWSRALTATDVTWHRTRRNSE